MPAQVVEAGSLLRELRDVWSDLARQEGQTGVLRACAMTLIVIASERDDPQQLGATLAGLMHEHPSRFILLHVSQSEERKLEGRVLVQCWMPFGRRQQICCEQIEVEASRGALGDSASLLLGLLVPDLPVALWCRVPELLPEAALKPVLSLAGRIIIDGARMSSPRQLLTHIVALRKGGAIVADLAWTRITRWREVLYRAFLDGGCAANPSRLESITVEYAGETPSITVCWLVAWLISNCGWKREGAGWTAAGNARHLSLVSTGEPVTPTTVGRIRRVRLTGPELDVRIERPEGFNATLSWNGLQSLVLFPRQSEEMLLREELAIFGRDRHFEAAIPLLLDLLGWIEETIP